METKTEKRGGAMKGAGRPKGDGKSYSFRLPGDLAAQLDLQENKTEFIKHSLRRAMLEGSGDVPAQGVGRAASVSGAQSEGSAGGVTSALPTQGGGAEPIGEVIPAAAVSPLSIPYFEVRVAAGFPVPLDNDERSQDINILSMLCPHPEASYLIRIKGDSMIDAGIFSGDIVIVDKSNRHPGPKDIAVCELNGEYTLKRFVEEDGQGWLVPANPAYPRFKVTPDDDFSIWGTVTYIIHKARD